MAYVEYEIDGKTIKARVQQKTDTLDNWMANELVLLDGEQAFIVDSTGRVVNYRLGDGTRKFSELPDIIQYDQAAYIAYVDEPTQPVAYTIVGEGTYGDIVIEENKFAVLGWDGEEWSVNYKGNITTVDIVNNLNSTSTTDALSANMGKVLNDAKENVSNKSTSLNDSTTQYPSNKVVNDALLLKENLSNKSTSIDNSTTKYPTNSAVYSYVNNILATMGTAVFGGVINESFDLTSVKVPTWFFAVNGEYYIPTIGAVTLVDDLNIITYNQKKQWDYEGLNFDISVDFLSFGSVQEMRDMSDENISGLESGKYKYVTLLGYYEKGDTPAPINYYLSDTTDEDDGGSVFEIGDIKLNHNFYNGILTPIYFGSTEITDDNYKKYIDYFNDLDDINISVNTMNYDIQVTVGEDGMFTTINKAIEYLSSKSILYKKVGFKAEILLLSGFIMQEQVFLLRKNIGFITISSEDDEVVVDRQYINENYYNKVNGWRNGVYPVFCAMESSVMPNINVLFSMNSTGDSDGRVGIMYKDNSSGVIYRGAGFKNVPWRGLYLDNGMCYARFSVWDNCGYEYSTVVNAGGSTIRPSNGTVLNIRDSSFTNTRSAISIADAYITASGCTFDGGTIGYEDSTSVAISCFVGTINASDSNYNNFSRYLYSAVPSTNIYANNSTFKANTTNAIDASGGIVSAESSTFLGATYAVNARDSSKIYISSSTLSGIPIISQSGSEIYAYNCSFGTVYNAFRAVRGNIYANNSTVLSTGSRYSGISDNSYVDLTGVRTPSNTLITNDIIKFNYKSKEGIIIYDVNIVTNISGTNSALQATTGEYVVAQNTLTADRLIRLPNIIGKFTITRPVQGNYVINIANADGTSTFCDLWYGETVVLVNESSDTSTWKIVSRSFDTSVMYGSTRPTGYRIGNMFFDSTLGKPIYKKDSTTWVDATGTTV